MKIIHGSLVFPGIATALALAGCDRPAVEERRTDDAKTTAKASGLYETTVQSIAAMRCAREMRCNNVGADKRYGTLDACTQKVLAETRDELNADECSGGINAEKLAECMSEIQSEDCNNPIDKLERIVACRESAICLATPRL